MKVMEWWQWCRIFGRSQQINNQQQKYSRIAVAIELSGKKLIFQQKTIQQQQQQQHIMAEQCRGHVMMRPLPHAMGYFK